jgi:hypothetical protein
MASLGLESEHVYQPRVTSLRQGKVVRVTGQTSALVTSLPVRLACYCLMVVN